MNNAQAWQEQSELVAGLILLGKLNDDVELSDLMPPYNDIVQLHREGRAISDIVGAISYHDLPKLNGALSIGEATDVHPEMNPIGQLHTIFETAKVTQELRKVVERLDRGDNVQFDNVREALDSLEKGDKKASAWELTRVGDIGEIEPIYFLIQDLFPNPGVVVMAGEGGGKKSFSAYDMAMCVAIGDPWLGRKVIQSPVLIIDQDNGERRTRQRLRMAMNGHNVDDADVYYISMAGVNLSSLDSINRIRLKLIESGAKFVILDALLRLSPDADENASKDMNIVFNNLKDLANEFECTILVIHHTNKTGNFRGSSVIQDAPDLLIETNSSPESPVITYKAKKTRDVIFKPFAAMLEVDGNSARMLPTEFMDTVDRGVIASFIMVYMAEHKTSTINEILEEAALRKIGGKNELTRSTIKKQVDNLLKEKVVKRADDGGPGKEAIYALDRAGLNEMGMV